MYSRIVCDVDPLRKLQNVAGLSLLCQRVLAKHVTTIRQQRSDLEHVVLYE